MPINSAAANILWHGLADDSVSPAFSIAYFRGVEAEMGHTATDTFLRLFLLPGWPIAVMAKVTIKLIS